MPQGSMLIGRARTPENAESIARSSALGHKNDSLCAEILNQPCGVLTGLELLHLMNFHQRIRIADNESFEQSVHEMLLMLKAKLDAAK